MALSTTIMELRERAREMRGVEGDRSRMIEEWRRDIGEVYDVIRGALKIYEADGSATIGVEDVEVSEETLGTAIYQRLVIDVVGRSIIVSPVARFTVGGSGRIDMYRGNRPTEDHRVFIVRGIGKPEFDIGAWFVEQKGETPIGAQGSLSSLTRGKRKYNSLEPSSIETAIDYLLKLP